ncbi:MAG: nucleotidyltransferase domain-containing protein [bacterium]|nr:nucleotidyltransferase domain-containing protein [bacterium]
MEIDTELKEKVALLAQEYNLSCVVLFGSQATGKTHKLSDTDIAFMADRNVDYAEKFEIENDFKETLKIKDIELVNMRNVSPLFMKQISDKGKLLYEDSRGRFTAYRIYAFKMYVDTAPLRRMREIFLNKFIAKHA